jgi:hypothetical protein
MPSTGTGIGPAFSVRKVPRRASALWGENQTGSEEDLPADEFLSKAVDPILDKISAQGIQSLTARERRILEKARQKMVRP